MPVLSRPLSGSRRARHELARPSQRGRSAGGQGTGPSSCNIQLGARSAPRRGFRPWAAGAPDSHRRATYGCDQWSGATARSQPTWKGLNSPLQSCGSFPFIPERFHVLLSSPFVVIFNSSPRYLFAIGLVVIHSLR